jgi:hypothetical protein
VIGQGGIRTLDTVARMPPFQGGAFNHSATCPEESPNRDPACTNQSGITTKALESLTPSKIQGSNASINRSTYYVQAGLK